MPHLGIVSRLVSAFRRPPPAAVRWPTQRPSSFESRREPAPPPLAPHPIAEPSVAATANEAVAVEAPVQPAAPREASAAAEDFVDSVKQLPLFSGTAMQLMKTVGRDHVSLEDLARLIAADAGLVAQLLRIVNSPFYGLPKQCATVGDAISVLGLSQVRRIVSAAVTQRPLANYLHGTRVVQTFARHQLLCASMSRHLALKKNLDGEVAYMAGLMHEVGRLAILARHPHLRDVLLNVEGDDDRLGLERESAHFGFDHAEVGGALLARWGLPAPIVHAVFDHESIEQPADPTSAVVWRANLLAHTMSHEPEGQDVQLPWMMAVDLTVAQRRRMVDEVATMSGGQG
jgi:HD-like signal output (HDOD) protein